jgi:MoxR-like ATPase
VSITELTSAEAVRAAMAEFDALGRDEFLEKYEYGPAIRYFLRDGEAKYDSKAIAGVAFGYQYPERGPLSNRSFSGGEATVKRRLEALGFEVEDEGAGSDGHPAADTLHLVVKWSARRHPETIELHREVADEQGSVWWGLATKSTEEWRISEQWLERLSDQIGAGAPTHVFLVGQTCWKTDLRAVTYSRDETDEALIPAYYADQEPTRYHLWVEVANFTETDRDTLLRELDPERDSKRGKPVALGNQTNPLIVRTRIEPRVWWVNQGSSYSRAREGGYLWAPLRDKVGNPKSHWQTMRHLRTGDVVLNYANSHLRARSEVTTEAVPSARPDPEADRAWEEDGLRVEVQTSELSDPIRLDTIPTEWRRSEGGPFTSDGAVQQGYLFPLSDTFAAKLDGAFPQLQLESEGTAQRQPRADEKTLEEIAEAVRAEGLEIDDLTLRRYHLSLNTRRGFVILAGVSGTGKTWLAEAYARAAGAKLLVVPVAPNWTTNEDLLGYRNPLDQQYYDTDFSQFLRDAAQEHGARGEAAQRFHLVLDEMNLARVEYYFAKFLSAMEQRARADTARIELAPNDTVALPPNLYVTGTVNVDETTHAFAEKVYDRAQLIELPVLRDELERQLIGRPYQALLLAVWDDLTRSPRLPIG